MKPLLYGLRFVISYHLFRKTRPLIRGLVLTNRCNLHCRHCKLGPRGDKDLTYDQVTAAIDTFYEQGGRCLYLEGGEPCLWHDGPYGLDDVVGFCGEEDYKEFAAPYLKESFNAIDVPVRFFHNDAHGLVCAPHLKEAGINLFNFSHEHPLAEMKELVGPDVALLGNIPPRDVLAQGTPEDVQEAVAAQLAAMPDPTRVVLSCGGGMPPEVSTKNIEAFLVAAGYSV